MNSNWSKIVEIIGKPERLFVGLMSGTSMDGLDVALCKIRGFGAETKFDLLQFETVPYQKEFSDALRKIFCKRETDLELVTLLHAEVALVHAEAVNACLKKWGIPNEQVDIIASHGQTIYHAPKNLHPDDDYSNATLQIGDADHIAVKTGIVTISDFRQKHIAKGGEGAPLAVYGDYLLLGSREENRVLLNLGGIANFTFLPADQNPEVVFATDVGPANTLIDWAVSKYFGLDYDRGGEIAFSGKVNDVFLRTLKMHAYFSERFPKSTGQEIFNGGYVERCMSASGQELDGRDVVATLAQLTIDTVAEAIENAIGLEMELALYVSGGGSRNKYIMQGLKAKLPGLRIAGTESLGILPEAKEAVLFAVLANEMLMNEPLKIGGTAALTMGKVSFPL